MTAHRIIYPDSKKGIQMKAVEVLTKIIVENAVEYPACIPASAYAPDENFRDFFIGTKENNPYIKEKSKATLTKEEEYAICVENDTVIIEGYDDAGTLYGCVDFYGRYVVPYSRSFSAGPYVINIFEKPFVDAFVQSAPAAKNRGLWTWGHVIYDFRGYLDNMLKLKMNVITIWNDFPPANAEEMVTYAHNCGIKVLWGFPWLWGTDCTQIDFDRLDEASDEIVAYYETNYAHLSGDGIYFQSFTELQTETIGKVLIADAVSKFVNDTAGKIFEKHPELELQFGLHSESVRNRLDFIGRVDPRIRIVWENCGCFPFSYIPEDSDNFEETKDFVDRISLLRGEGEKFGVVLKGLTKLNWATFVHQTGPFMLGCATKEFRENRIDRKKKIWHYVQAGWLIHSDNVLELVRIMIRNTKGDMYLTALVEDSMFEGKFYYPVALLGEMMWDGESDLKAITHRVALRGDVEFA